MYPYHNIIKKRIKNGELDSILPIKDEKYAFAFVFKTNPIFRPIKYKSVEKYSDILLFYKVKL